MAAVVLTSIGSERPLYGANTTSVSRESVALECKIRVGTSQTGTIKRYQLEGPEAACAYFEESFQSRGAH
jgi:hypothetical protein